MRFVPVAIAVMLACAAVPSLAQAPDSGAAPAAPDVSAAPPQPSPAQTSETPPAPQAGEVIPPAAPSGRFGFNRVDGGLLRLDSQTGEVAFCSARNAGWTCETAAEDRAALEKEIGRLQDEVGGLKRELADLREPPPPRPPAYVAPPAEKPDDAAKLRQDLERARVAFENAWQRLVDMLMNFQKDVMRKS
jgi:hypothetical protein